MNLLVLKSSHTNKVIQQFGRCVSSVLALPLYHHFPRPTGLYNFRLRVVSFLSLQFCFGSVKPQLLAMYSTLASSGIRVKSEVDVASMGPRREGEGTAIGKTCIYPPHIYLTLTTKIITAEASHTIT